MNKRASTPLDYVNVPLIIFTFILLFVVGHFILDSLNDGIKEMDGDSINTTLMSGHLENGITSFENVDYLFVFFLIGLTMSLWIGAYYINSTPVMFWISIILLFVVIILGVAFNNAYEELTQTDMNSSTSEFPIMGFIMNNLPLYIVLMIISTIVIFYSKSSGGGYEGY